MSDITKRNKRIAQIKKELKATIKKDKRYNKEESVKKAKLYKELKDLGSPSKFGEYWINTFLKPKSVKSPKSGHQREMDVIEDEDKRAKVRDLITRWFKSKGKKVPSLQKGAKDEKGRPVVTSTYRPFVGSNRHRKYGAIDLNVSILGNEKDQQDFINFAIKNGATVIDEKYAISQGRGTGNRNIFHVDFKPGGGKLIQEVPDKPHQIFGGEGKFVGLKKKRGQYQGVIGTYTTVKPGEESYGGFIAPGAKPKAKEKITETVEETVTDKELKDFPTGKSQGEPQVEAPEGYAGPDEEGVKLALEGSAIPLKNENVEFKEKAKMEEYVPSHTSLDQLPAEMKVEDSVEEKVSDPQDLIVDYKNREAKGFQEGGSVLKEPELSEDEEIAARQTGDTDIISEAIEDKVEGTIPQDSWRLKPKEPKPPVEASFDEKGDVVLTKQQEVEDVSTKSDQELKDNLEETLEVKSKPGSDTVTLSPRKSQVQRNKALKAELDKRKKEEEARAALSVQRGIEETKSIMAKPEVKVDLKEKVDVEETADPQAFDLQTYIQQTLQRDDDAREIMRNELAKANEAELNIQKVEPYRFWNSMSTPAKIIAGIGMLIGGYAAKDSPAGLQAVMNVIDGAVNADIQAQKLTQQQQLVVAKEATRRAKAAVDKYKAMSTSPIQKAKLMELSQALEIKKAGVAKKQQLQALKQYVMNKAREGKLHLVPPALLRMVYPKEEMKRIDTMRLNFEKERKERKIQPILSAYRRMHNLISQKEDITGMDDIAIVFQFMKMLDPNSVVREGEFKTAETAGPRARFFARQWNRMWNGGRFTQADRKGFLRASLKLVKPAMDEEKEIQRKYISMARRYGYPAAFIVSPATRYFDLPGTKDEAAIRRIMKEQGKTRDEAESIHFQVAEKIKPRYVYRKGVRYRAN